MNHSLDTYTMRAIACLPRGRSIMLRVRALVSPLIFTIACATGPSTSAPPGSGNPGNPNPGAPPSTISTDQLATALGVSIVSSEPSGAPRMLRTIVPRPSAAGVTAAAAARDHIAALSALWGGDAQPMALANNGAQQIGRASC